VTGGFSRAERCQYDQSLRRWPRPLTALRAAVLVGRRTWGRRGTPRGLGTPSVYAPGDVVRVKDAAAIDALLDERGIHRGLLFTRTQRTFLGATLVVDRPVRHMLDDRGVMRPISRAVSLVGATCDAGPDGCGRSCALLWKDDWLEPAPAGATGPTSWSARLDGRPAAVRSAEEIAATLGPDGRLDGMAPPLDLDRYAGRSFPAARPVTQPAPLGGRLPVPPVGDWWVIDDTRCAGRELADPHPCDRRCALVWHRSWLDL
jgi:hypothetical protein